MVSHMGDTLSVRVDKVELCRIAKTSAKAYSMQARASETIAERNFWMNESRGAIQEHYKLKRELKKGGVLQLHDVLVSPSLLISCG